MINVTIGESKTQSEKPFPKLMKQLDAGWIIYMLSETKALHLTGKFAGGFTEDYHIDKNTVDYNEPITLQNA